MSMEKIGDILVDNAGRCGKIASVFADGVMAHPIEVETVVCHSGMRISTITFWQRFGTGFSGKWFDSPVGNYWLKATVKTD